MSSQSDIKNIHKISDERYRIDNDYHNKYGKRDQIGEIQADKIDSEESETDERDQIENKKYLIGLVTKNSGKMTILYILKLSWNMILFMIPKR